MYSHILVAVDGSEIGQRALLEAIDLAKIHQAQLDLVHVVDVVPPGGEVTVPFEAYHDSCVQGGQQVLDRALVLASGAGVPIQSRLIETGKQDASSAILEEAKRSAADLIVLGTHGRSGLRRLVLGSVAEGVVRHAPVPVLLVHAGETRPGE
jgi:nucleotide-binding universal stress UspA family protein